MTILENSSQQLRSLINMQQSVPYHVTKEITLNDTWSIGRLSKFNYDEKQ